MSSGGGRCQAGPRAADARDIRLSHPCAVLSASQGSLSGLGRLDAPCASAGKASERGIPWQRPACRRHRWGAVPARRRDAGSGRTQGVRVLQRDSSMAVRQGHGPRPSARAWRLPISSAAAWEAALAAQRSRARPPRSPRHAPPADARAPGHAHAGRPPGRTCGGSPCAVRSRGPPYDFRSLRGGHCSPAKAGYPFGVSAGLRWDAEAGSLA